MPEKIERYETITVKSAEKNNYGDLIVNKNLKIGVKRSQLFDTFQIGAEVKLGYATYMNKEYIASAEQTGVHKSIDVEERVKKSEISPQEKGMWWKEMGECLRSKLFNTDDGIGKHLWKCYVTQMITSLEITIPQKDTKLVEEIKKIGGVEMR